MRLPSSACLDSCEVNPRRGQDRVCGLRVLGRGSGHHVQHDRRVLDGLGERTEDVAGQALQWEVAGVRHQTERRLDPVEALRGSRVLDGAAGLLCDAGDGEVAGHGCCRAARGTPRHPLLVERVVRRSVGAVVGVGAAAGQDRKVGLADDDRAGVAQALDHGRIGLRDQRDATGDRGGERPARGRGQTFHVEGVLDDDRHAFEQPDVVRAARASLVGRRRVSEGIRIHLRERVVVRLVDLDAPQEALDELHRGELLGLQRLQCLGDAKGRGVLLGEVTPSVALRLTAGRVA